MAEILMVRKLADKSSGERIVRFDPETGERKLVNPATPGEDHEPWPLAGVQIENDAGAPRETTVSTGWVDAGAREGWITLENQRVVVRPGGPPEDPYRVDPEKGIPHMLRHADAIVIHTVDGPVRYRVVGQPDKYHSGPEGTDAVGDPTAEVRHFYMLELEG